MSGGTRGSDKHRAMLAAQREAERQRKAEARAEAAAEKQRLQDYRKRRESEVEAKNSSLKQRVEELQNILQAGLGRSANFDLTSLRRKPQEAPLDLGDDASPVAAPSWDAYKPRPPGAISRAFGGAERYERRLSVARDEFERAQQEYSRKETERQQRVASKRHKHSERAKKARARVDEHNQRVESLIRGHRDREQDAVENYLDRVLSVVPRPAGFPSRAEVTFNPRAEQVVVQVEFPSREIVPNEAGYKYMPTKDEERTSSRTRKDVAALYRSVMSQFALLCIRDIFNSEPALSSVGFNGHVHAINPATGDREYPCIISVNVDRSDFPSDSKLRDVTPEACLQHLKAIVSHHPYDLEPIEPILDFDWSKYSFVEGLDAVSTLDSRPDLMEMSPSNFEHLVRQIFEAQGAEGWTTQQSNDDGVDAVIARRTALFGGLSIVQAKRYSKVVGINHVRELAGAIEEKKAGWGVLVTTSWFTSKCWQKAREHGRMELIDGERLKFLIKEHLGKDVLIGIPNRLRQKGTNDS
ncbi:restriction endonuclease [Saccharopolyspora cebuensis]|uniref:Restriction endonuclease n=1 Tax=Saccharopolyspora cebuensis TaxID=418759 RepID=A0ABV4CG98_9PSEU